MRVALHISDPHFGTERARVVKALERLAHSQAPTVVILSGDITQRARNVEFNAASAFMDRLAIPSRLVIAGNHDIPLFDLATRLFRPYLRYKRAFGDDLEPIHESSELLVIGVRTTRRYRHIEGEVSVRQIERVAQRLKQAAQDQLRIVVTHQPVHVTHASDEEHLLRGHEQAISKWAEAGVDLILGGHIHRPFICGLHDRVANMPRQVWAVQAGTAVSSRIRHDSSNSINLIRHAFDGMPRHCVVERWDYDDDSDEFIMIENRVMQQVAPTV
ncbi:metallophosphoesterase [Candidimonas sp. SYP-B2681]|uniref:metallophosphoesterase family protein n=1 Tax=Candidimonas sp. SYP-B2681 TaxID=2497686 RepID=UPI000F86E078|nr:metallophosphoesterase [Candidimonas sp. SYP-B2681]RTZ47468.1 metallophosphoesterase [Candidimonas sp. SYP-B2681]